MTETWAQWFRANLDKFLLLVLLGVWTGFIIHVMHDNADSDSVHWFRESANTVQGTLLGLITGSMVRRDPPPGTVSQITTKTTVQEAPPEEHIKA